MDSAVVLNTLKSRFGFSSFREGQQDIVESVLAGKDTMAVMPTGRGKSLCYQLPSLLKPGIVVVVSPLIALIKDQVGALTAKGIAAGGLYSGQTMAEKRQVFASLEKASSYLLFISPERVQKEGFAPWLKGRNLSLFAIDEAHCVSQWGPDFRPDYHKLKLLRDIRPDVPILALTATATPPVLRDIAKQLSLREPDRHIHGFYRPNLYYQVENCANDETKIRFIKEALARFPSGRILIYCGTRNQCEDLSSELSGSFSDVGFYHAGLNTETRTQVQQDYETGAIRILAATNAFGMGIDHPDVRLVIHFQMPANMESYYQEIGRAGRDGAPSTCLMLYSKKDRGLHSFFIKESKADQFTISQRWKALETITQFVEGGECRHSGILTYFKDSQRIKSCGHCDTCDPKSPRRVPEPAASFRSVVKPHAAPVKKKAAKTKAEEPLSSLEELRMDSLREWRKSYAESKDIPAFLVFSNKTLRDLAVKAPKTLNELEDVYGFGPHKTEHLGKEILETLRTLE